MWPDLVEVLPVGVDRVAGLRDAPPPVLVQQFVPHPPVVAFHYRVLDRLARLDELQRHAVFVRPGVEPRAAKLGTIVEHDARRVAAQQRDLLQHADHPHRRQARVDFARAQELYRLALLAYTADTRVPRRLAFDGWQRDLVLHVPVADPKAWLMPGACVVELLSFLTGDRWRVEFFASSRRRPPRDQKRWDAGARPKTDVVSLFSGGLDSLIGVSDLLAAGDSPLLVGHADFSSTAAVQKELSKRLLKEYPSASPLLQFWIKPPRLVGQEIEDTTRGRSFLFFTLATLVASGLGRPTRLVIPENGLIALNAPLAQTRSTKQSAGRVHKTCDFSGPTAASSVYR